MRSVVILFVSISWLYRCNIHYKDVVKHSNVGQKFSYVLLALSPCVLIQKYRHVAGLGLVLKVLASALALASTFWPRLTSLFTRGLFALRHQLGRNVTARLAIANYFLLGHPLWYILVNLPASVMPAPLQRRQYYLTLKKQITFWTQASGKKQPILLLYHWT